MLGQQKSYPVFQNYLPKRVICTKEHKLIVNKNAKPKLLSLFQQQTHKSRFIVKVNSRLIAKVNSWINCQKLVV